MEELIFDGKKFISSRRAAREFSYAPDYIGQLCREGKISARLVGRTWYVSEESLEAHVHQSIVEDIGTPEQNVSEIRKSESINQAEFPLNKWAFSPSRDKTIRSRYETDERPLMPSLRKEERGWREEPIPSLEPFQEEQIPTPYFPKRGEGNVEELFPFLETSTPLRKVSASPPVAFPTRAVLGFVLVFSLAVGGVSAGILPQSIEEKLALYGKEHPAVVDTLDHLNANAAAVLLGEEGTFLEQLAIGVYRFVSGIGSLPESIAVGIYRTISGTSPPASFTPPPSEITKLMEEKLQAPLAPSRDALATSSSLVVEERKIDAPPVFPISSPAPPPPATVIIERAVASGLTAAYVDEKLNQLENKLSANIFDLSSRTGATETRIIETRTVVAQSQRIDELEGIDVSNNSTWDGGRISNVTITGSSFSGTTGEFSGGITVGGSLTAGGSAFVIDAAAGNVGIGTSTPYAKLSVVGEIVGANFTATSTTATSTFYGHLLAAFIPTRAHTFSSWTPGASGTNYDNASLVIDPTSAAADTNLLALAVGGSVKFLVDAEGDVFANSLTTTGTVTLSTTTASTFTVENNTTLGDSITDTTTINGTLIVTGTTTSSTLQGKFGIGTTSPWARLSVAGLAGGTDPLFSISSSTAGFSTTTVFHVDSNGLIGVGTTSPWGLLSVNANAIAGPAFVVGSSTATSFIVTNGGLVGVGRTNPSAQFHLNTAAGINSFSIGSTTQYLLVNDEGEIDIGPLNVTSSGEPTLDINSQGNTSSGNTLVAITTRSETDSAVSELRLNKIPPASGNFSATANGEVLGRLSFYGVNTSPIYTIGAKIEAIQNGTDANGVPTDLAFFTNNDSLTAATERLRINKLGNVGIGTTSPWAQLSVNPNGISGPAFAVGSSTATSFQITNGGLVGIGTTSPYRSLSVTNTSAQAAFAYDSTRYADVQVDSVGDLILNPSGDDVRLNDENLFVCTGGACPSGVSGTGNLVVENKLGVGTASIHSATMLEVSGGRIQVDNDESLGFHTAGSAPTAYVTGNSSSNYIRFFTSNGERVRIDSSGSVGIGTTTPTKQLSISDLLYVGAGGATGLGTATSTFQGDIKIIGKLDVGTIDPVYTIDGVKYATYGHSTIGIKEEVVTTVTLSDKNTETGYYEHTIHFSNLSKGSDLWLFYQVTNFGDAWQKLVVTLTPGFDGAAFYRKLPGQNALVIASEKAGEVSARLIADRYDAGKWPNLRPDQDDPYTGHTVESKR